MALAIFPFAIAGVAEMGSGVRQLLAGLAAAVLVAIPFVLERQLSTKDMVIVIAVRAIFYFVPLLVGAAYVDKYVTKRIA